MLAISMILKTFNYLAREMRYLESNLLLVELKWSIKCLGFLAMGTDNNVVKGRAITGGGTNVTVGFELAVQVPELI